MAIPGDDFQESRSVGSRAALNEMIGVPDGHAIKRVRRTVLRALLLADIVGLATAAVLGPLLLSLISGNTDSTAGRSGSAVLYGLGAIPLFLGVFACYGLYRGTTRRISLSVFSDLRHVIHGLLVGGFLCAVLGYGAQHLGLSSVVTVAKIVALCVVAAVTVPLARIVSFGLMGRAPEGSVPIIVVGTGKLADTVASHLRAHTAVRFVGFVDDNPWGRGRAIGGLDDLPALCRQHGVARVVVCFSQTHPERTIDMLKRLSGTVSVSIVPRYYELISARSHVEDLSGLPMVDIAPASMGVGARWLKRSFDVAISSLVLLVTSPLFALAAVAVAVSSPGPVFFRQERMGRGKRTFSILKFRTMVVDAEDARDNLLHLNQADGPLFKMAEDPRVTPVGRFLRKTSLDEIPQLFNVWKGDMSLVGPRPFVVPEAEEIDGWARKRFEVKPGMTGLWQVSGRNELSHLEMCRLDYLYVASWSFWWDVQILWRTPATVVKGRGAF